MPARPIVSVVISTHNRATTLGKTLECLETQTVPPDSFEVVVIDDGSTDHTLDFLANYQMDSSLQLQWYSQQERGAPGARNAGVSHARGDLIAFTDDDCLPASDWLEKGLPYFSSWKVVGVEGAILSQTEPEQKLKGFDHTPELRSRGRVVLGRTANMLYRRSVLETAGGFDERFTMPFGVKRSCREDTDLAWRVQAYGEIPFAGEVVVRHPRRMVSGVQRVRMCQYKMLDAVMFQKHPERFRDVLGLTFQVHPLSMVSLVWLVYGFAYFSVKRPQKTVDVSFRE